MNLDNIDFYRYFSFDLSIDLLKQNYPNPDINRSWTDIFKYLSANGFSHRQYSGYLSLNKMNESQMIQTARDLFRALNWLSLCAKRFDSTAIVQEQSFDILSIFKQETQGKIFTPTKKLFVVSNPPEENREDILLPKKEPGTRELLSEKSELTLTPEQFRALSEAGVGLKVTVDSKDLKKASKILEAANRPAQAGVYKPKR